MEDSVCTERPAVQMFDSDEVVAVRAAAPVSDAAACEPDPKARSSSVIAMR
jgi:hypothetical protein